MTLLAQDIYEPHSTCDGEWFSFFRDCRLDIILGPMRRQGCELMFEELGFEGTKDLKSCEATYDLC